MVGVRAKVLGQMGWTTSPYQRAGALSCPSLAIYGPGSYGISAFIVLSPSRCPKPSAPAPHGGRIIPDDKSIPSSASLAYRDGAMPNFAFW